jgi:hypothetical protein
MSTADTTTEAFANTRPAGADDLPDDVRIPPDRATERLLPT